MQKVSLIAELAYSHEGDINYLKELLEKIKDTKIDFIKFQILLDKDDFYVKTHPGYNSIDKWCFSEEEWEEILFKNKKKSLVTVLDRKVLIFLEKNKDMFSGIEIHPSCLVDENLLYATCELCEKLDKKLFLGISGYDLEKIDIILKKVKKYKIKEKFLIYGFQNFPTDIQNLNLNKIKYLKEHYDEYQIVYADHTEYNDNNKRQIILLTFLLGAYYQEIHCVLNRGEVRTDYITGIEANEFDEIYNTLSLISNLLSRDSEEISIKEKEYFKNLGKIPVYGLDKKKGEILKKEDILYKRTENKNFSIYIENNLEKILNKKLKKNVLKDETIYIEDFEEV